VALVLLIACANVANLTLARMVERGRELAIRSALGAGRTRLLRQLLTESTILALAGGGLGLLFAYATRGLLTAFAARLTPRAGEVTIDVPVLLFTLVTSVLTGLLAGTLPGLPGRERIAPLLLAESGRTTGDRRRQRVRAGLVAWQLALSFVLLIGAALMLRSFANLRSVDAGFKGDHVLTARLNLNFSTYTNAERPIDVDRVNAFYRSVEDRLRALPGVVAIGSAWTFPLNNAFQNDGTFAIEGRGESAGPAPKATFIGMSSAYFETLGVPVLRGRAFDERDRAGAPGAVVVNQQLARRHWGDADPIGARISSDGGRTWRTIVGVVGDVRQQGLDREPGDAVYLPFREFPGFNATLFVRTLDAGRHPQRRAVLAPADHRPPGAVRRAGPGHHRGRPQRPHRVLREPTHPRDRDPHGPRRRPAADHGHGAPRRDDLGGDRARPRHRRRAGALAAGLGPALRRRSERPGLLRRLRAGAGGRRLGRLPAARPPRDVGEPDGGPARGGLMRAAALSAMFLVATTGDASRAAPAYDETGALLRPEGYRRWVYVGASLGLSYAEGSGGSVSDMFHHVYLQPAAYDAYRRTGRFPDKTVLMLELHAAAQKVAPSRHGRFEGERLGLEAAVKDTSRFPEGWAYFSFGDGSRRGATAFPRSACFDCHRQHAAVDNVFVQFYPVLRDRQ
jgi:hypothetical protein